MTVMNDSRGMFRGVKLLAFAAATLLALSACTSEEIAMVEANYRSREVTTLTAAPVDVSHINVPNITIQADCEQLIVNLVEWEPLDEVRVGYGAQPPGSVSTDANGDYSQTFVSDAGHGTAIGWAVADGNLVLADGTAYC